MSKFALFILILTLVIVVAATKARRNKWATSPAGGSASKEHKSICSITRPIDDRECRPADHTGYLAWHELTAAALSSSVSATGSHRESVVSYDTPPTFITGALSAFLSSLTAVTIVAGLHAFGAKEDVIFPIAVLMGPLLLYFSLSGVESAVRDLTKSHKHLEQEVNNWRVETWAANVILGIVVCVYAGIEVVKVAGKVYSELFSDDEDASNK